MSSTLLKPTSGQWNEPVEEDVTGQLSRQWLRGRNHLEGNHFNKAATYPEWVVYGSASIENWSDGVRAAAHTVKRTWPAILAIQCLIASVIAAYFLLPFSRPFFDTLIYLRDRFGPVFGFFGMGIIVGGLSETLNVITQQSGRWKKQNLRNLRFNICFFGFWGAVSFYKFNVYAYFLGTGSSPWTLICKSFVDLVVYSALFYNPVCSVVLLMRRFGYDVNRFRAEATPLKGYVCRVVVPTQLAHWCLWVPLVPIIFLLPTTLQLPIVILGVTLWVILLSALNSKSK